MVKKEKRSGNDRRETDDKRSEDFIEYFISEDDEKRSGVDRRKDKKSDKKDK